MKERVFLDTNVLVYADDRDAGAKRRKARAILRDAFADGAGVVSTQVLQEYFVIATRKLGEDADVARRKVELLAKLDVVQVDVEMVLAAIDLHRLRSISFWDALVVKAAVAGGCARLLTEDLQDGEVIDGVRVANPLA